MRGNTLGVDRGHKYIGLAYINAKANNMIMPIGYIMNDKNLFFDVGEILQRYYIDKVVIGYPKQHKSTQKAIDDFLENILFINSEIEIERVDEEYSSVIANEKTQSTSKDIEEDTLAAMVILEGYLDKLSKQK